MADNLGDDSRRSVTAIVSTYNSPEKLRVALKSVINQTRPVDEIIVVGDGCSETTVSEINRLALKNLRYVNLPFRCGEQAIPNAVGTVLSKTRYVAYLNHDDLWLPEHIEEALNSLRPGASGWYLGAAAFSETWIQLNGETIPVFETRTDPDRSVGKSYSRSYLALEPASSWVIERMIVLNSGNWRPAWQMARTPVSELPLRILRKHGEPNQGHRITVAKVLGERSTQKGPHYFHQIGPFSYLDRILETYGQEWGNFFSWPATVSTWRSREGLGFLSIATRFEPFWSLSSRIALFLYLQTGIDIFEYLLRVNIGRGTVLQRALRGRTGERALGMHSVTSALRGLGVSIK